MQLFVGVTDIAWFDFLSRRTDVDEVNFWQPGGNSLFRALQPGELFLFKLKAPRNVIAGGGYFAYSTILPLSYAWSSFEEKNGAASLPVLRANLERLRKHAGIGGTDFNIGCIMLTRPFFLPEHEWIPTPSSFSPNIVQGRRYDLDSPEGQLLWQQVQYRLAGRELEKLLVDRVREDPQYSLAKLRPGQGVFRAQVADAYGWKCAVTRERVRPTLEAAHIQAYSEGGPHLVQNGLMLRADLHRLMDQGYATISTDMKLLVSRRVREDFDNGKEYYAMQTNPLLLPADRRLWPNSAYLDWHRSRFIG